MSKYYEVWSENNAIKLCLCEEDRNEAGELVKTQESVLVMSPNKALALARKLTALAEKMKEKEPR